MIVNAENGERIVENLKEDSKMRPCKIIYSPSENNIIDI